MVYHFVVIATQFLQIECMLLAIQEAEITRIVV
jgi:hypothetical protein